MFLNPQQLQDSNKSDMTKFYMGECDTFTVRQFQDRVVLLQMVQALLVTFRTSVAK